MIVLCGGVVVVQHIRDVRKQKKSKAKETVTDPICINVLCLCVPFQVHTGEHCNALCLSFVYDVLMTESHIPFKIPSMILPIPKKLSGLNLSPDAWLMHWRWRYGPG